MMPIAVPVLDGNEGKYLQECVETGFVSSVGSFVDRFEARCAALSGCPGAVATSSGTAALHAALVELGVGIGDLVLTSSYSFIATANAIRQCGADPWFLDITPGAWTVSPALLQEALSNHCHRDSQGRLLHSATGRRVAAVLPVHAMGFVADLAAIDPIRRPFRLPMLADAAAAIGASYKGRPAGAQYADLSSFSFNGNKIATSGGGGAVVGPDPEMLRRIKHLTTTARVGAGYDHDRAGFNYRMTNLQAAVGLAQLERIDAKLAAKHRIAARYDDFAQTHPLLSPFPRPDDQEATDWLSGVLLDPRINPAFVIAGLRERGIDARPFWKPLHLQKPYIDCPRGTMDVCEAFWPRVLPLPCSSNLDFASQEFVLDALSAVLSQTDALARETA